VELPQFTIGRKPAFKKIAGDVDAYEVFTHLEHAFETCFLMESLGEQGNDPTARYAFIGFDPMHIITAREKTLTVDGKSYTTDNPYFALRKLMPEQTVTRRYAGGLVGYISYEAVNYFEPSVAVKTHPIFDQLAFGAYEDGLIIDTYTNDLTYFYYTKDRSKLVEDLLKEEPPKRDVQATFIRATATKEEHGKKVSSVKEHIKAGNIFQCEVGFKNEFQIEGEALPVYEKLRTVNPSPYMYYLKFGEQKIVGASPELLFSLHDGEMTTRPIAGTIKRGKDAAEDRQLARQLLHDPKENAEHNMLVDLHRNDIGRVAQFGSVRVPALKYLIRFSHVQHIETKVVGLLKSGEDMFSALAANFPAGTLAGAPKIEAIKIIDANEPEARGPYGGGVGYFGFNGDCSFAIAIRSLFVTGQRAYAQTSGGIVYDSQSENEYEEIQNKFAAMKKVLEV
jgi:anthranilate synthase component I